ncbi:ERI1 exoribonuclease 2-like [Thrips palmi]|uniref:ERI1 exoribonuclease 2-like n=1 Tax=Thrips palmi TaxID=161013 RepID=A0A6P8YZZ1_THRPL|nr:ERI1 exoribonuclease 2-like [Thrips palmi]
MDKVKALALELGFVETFNVCQPVKSVCQEKGGLLNFDFVIVIDFESTCWDTKDKQSKWQNLAEIIEFPAVLLNLKTGKIEDEFHQYVMPVENPTLSEFCTKLTGITQETVNAGIPLGTCIMLFNKWINQMSLERKMTFHKPCIGHKTCTFVTWSDWDLSMCLQNETKRKQLKKPDVLSQWIDLRLSYRKFYQRKPQGLKGALAELGLPFTGREHSGIIDARNTANLVYRMVKDGWQLIITSSTQLSSPQVNAKRCPLGTLKNSGTPLSREGQSKGRTLRSTFLNHSKPEKDNLVKLCLAPGNIYKDKSNKKTVGNGLLGKTSPFNSSRNVPDNNNFMNNVLNTSTPKRQNLVLSSCKRTPPLCRCGRRAVCKVANSPGPNQGRSFFTCPNPRRSLGMVSKSCSYFMWC